MLSYSQTQGCGAVMQAAVYHPLSLCLMILAIGPTEPCPLHVLPILTSSQAQFSPIPPHLQLWSTCVCP